MDHSPVIHKRYTPKTDGDEWVSRAERIKERYDRLLPIIQAIQAQHPETMRMNLTKIDESDGFSRLIDLVPNVNQVVQIMAARPKKLGVDRLCDFYAPKTRAIFEEVNTLLKQYLPEGEAKKDALTISDDLEWALNETYLAAETMRAGKKAEAERL